MSFARPLALRAITLIGVLLVVLLLLVVTLGATGFSDRVLQAIVSQEMRGIREGLAQGDPEEIRQILEVQRSILERFHGLDRAWYTRLPDMLLRVILLDLGEEKAEDHLGAEIVIKGELDDNTIMVTSVSLADE